METPPANPVKLQYIYKTGFQGRGEGKGAGACFPSRDHPASPPGGTKGHAFIFALPNMHFLFWLGG